MAYTPVGSAAAHHDFLCRAGFARPNPLDAWKVYGFLEHSEVSRLTILDAISHESPQVFLAREGSF